MSVAKAQILDKRPANRVPRLGFVGTGWIGRLRMQSLLHTELAEFCAAYDVSLEAAEAAAALCSGMQVPDRLNDLMAADLDGLVIATPSAQHARQCITALSHDKAVFCQKPLARTAAETARVIEAARLADKLLAVDFSYRHLAGVATLRDMIKAGELGTVFAGDLVFHNAYGPDKHWFYDMRSSGGGCVMDLGIHLVDLAMWLLGDGAVTKLSSTLLHRGQPLSAPYDVVEDFALAEFNLEDARLRLSCSWNLHAGRDAIIEASFYGTRGGAAIRNVNGSFFDFELYRLDGTAEKKIAGYPDDWGGRALVDWVQRLSHSSAYDPKIAQVLKVAEVIDRIYRR